MPSELSVVSMPIHFKHCKFSYDAQAKYVSYKKWRDLWREFPDESVPNKKRNYRTWKYFRAAGSAVPTSVRTLFPLVISIYEIRLSTRIALYWHYIIDVARRELTESEGDTHYSAEPVFGDPHLQACLQRHNLKILCNCTGGELNATY